MMNKRSLLAIVRLAAITPVLAAASCGLPAGNAGGPTSMQSLGTVIDNHPPESANGLPRGAEVTAPLTSASGQLNSVAVGGPGTVAGAPFRY